MVLNLTDLRLGGGGGTTVFLFLGFSWNCLLLSGIIEAAKWIKINMMLKKTKINKVKLLFFLSRSRLNQLLISGFPPFSKVYVIIITHRGSAV